MKEGEVSWSCLFQSSFRLQSDAYLLAATTKHLDRCPQSKPWQRKRRRLFVGEDSSSWRRLKLRSRRNFPSSEHSRLANFLLLTSPPRRPSIKRCSVPYECHREKQGREGHNGSVGTKKGARSVIASRVSREQINWHEQRSVNWSSCYRGDLCIRI